MPVGKLTNSVGPLVVRRREGNCAPYDTPRLAPSQPPALELPMIETVWPRDDIHFALPEDKIKILSVNTETQLSQRQTQ